MSAIIVDDVAEYAPISPRSAGTALDTSQASLEEVTGIARSLIATIELRERKYQSKVAADARVLADERGIIEELQEQITELQEKLLPTQHQPDGYVYNSDDRAPHLEIPIQDGYYQPAHWVKQLPDGRVQALPKEYSANTVPLILELYATPIQYNEEEAQYINPVMPLPGWILALFRGPSVKFAELVVATRSRCSWPVQAEVQRLRNLVLGEEDVEQQIKDMQEQLRSIRSAKECAHGRLERSDFVGKVHDLRLMPNMGRNHPDQHHHARPNPKNGGQWMGKGQGRR
jgi:hypothetical protein